MNTSKIRPFAEYIMILYFSGNISSIYYMGVLSYANASEYIITVCVFNKVLGRPKG